MENCQHQIITKEGSNTIRNIANKDWWLTKCYIFQKDNFLRLPFTRKDTVMTIVGIERGLSGKGDGVKGLVRIGWCKSESDILVPSFLDIPMDWLLIQWSQCQVSWATAGVVTRGEAMCFGTCGAGSLWRGPTYLAPRPHSCNGPFSWRIVGDSPSWYGRRRPSIWCTMPCCASSIIARNWSGHLPQRRRHYILCNV